MAVAHPIVVDAEQRSARWYEARLGKVTGSRAEDTMSFYAVTIPMIKKADEYFGDPARHYTEDEMMVLGELKENYPFEYVLRAEVPINETAARLNYRKQLVAERLTQMPDDLDPYITKEMRWGIMNEEIAKQKYQLRSRNIVVDAPFMHHPEIMAGASPDGTCTDRITGEIGNIEIKCLKSSNHLYEIIQQQKVPEKYKAQIQMQMWINGAEWCDFVGFDSRMPEGMRMFVNRVERDDFYIDEVLVPNILRFLEGVDRDEAQFHAIRKSMIERIKKEVDAKVATGLVER